MTGGILRIYRGELTDPLLRDRVAHLRRYVPPPAADALRDLDAGEPGAVACTGHADFVVGPDGRPLSSVLSFYFRDEVLPYYAGDDFAASDALGIRWDNLMQGPVATVNAAAGVARRGRRVRRR